MLKLAWLTALSISLIGTFSTLQAQDLQKESDFIELSDDPSRADLFDNEIIPSRLKDDEAGEGTVISFNLPKEFSFPDDAITDKVKNVKRKEELFGIDLSHHSANLPVKNLKLQHVDFVYVKATQGVGFKDGKFGAYWTQLDALPDDEHVYRGAYHFLSSIGSGKAQAQSFLNYVNLHGGIRTNDLPPCLDLEWDRTATNPDQWKGHDPKEIIANVRDWLDAVQAETHRRPIVYTAESWWTERGIPEAQLANLNTEIWIADYSVTHKAAERPALVNKQQQKLWQFADDASLTTGYQGGLDANIYYGTKEAFLKDFGIQANK